MSQMYFYITLTKLLGNCLSQEELYQLSAEVMSSYPAPKKKFRRQFVPTLSRIEEEDTQQR